MSRENMSSVREFQVPSGSVALWWVGQNGFLLKSPEGTVCSVDAYLTNSCQPLGEAVGVDLSRKVPVFIQPEELEGDYFFCTHSHQDHADPETISNLNKEKITSFVGPGLVCETFRRCGIEDHQLRQIYAGGSIVMGDITVSDTFAMPTDDSDLNHLGLFFAINEGPRIYFTGDTDFTERLGHVASLKPDIMICCINGGFNNLSHYEAAEVARLVKPRIAIPCHYDMFPDSSMDPRQFRANLRYLAPEVEYLELKHMEPVVLSFSEALVSD